MKKTTGWLVSESIAAELDMTLSLALSKSFRGLIPELEQALERLPADWYTQGHELLRGLAGDLFSVFTPWAALAGVTTVADYSTATMHLREMDSADLAAAAVRAAAAMQAPLPADADPFSLLVALSLAMRERVDQPFPPDTEGLRKLHRECRFIVDVTRDGARHTHFWHWVDRFYYEIYQPWRQTRADVMADERERAQQRLGGEAGAAPPDLGWLPRQNPLTPPSSVLHGRIARGEERVIFWVEPLGTWDVLGLLPGGVLTSFGEPGEVQELFRRRAAQIAGGLKALADPTRLTMLRIVRQLEVDNSEMASYMELSHPTVSVHARVLREANLLHSRRQGRRLFHSLDPDALRQLLRAIEGFLEVSDEP